MSIMEPWAVTDENENAELIKQWCSGDREPDEDGIAWLRARPECLHDLMQRFPPSCVVRAIAGKSFVVPGPGRLGIVSSWVEPDSDCPCGQVSVRHLDEEISRISGGILGYCRADDLEVVAYWKGWTPERLQQVLGGTQ